MKGMDSIGYFHVCTDGRALPWMFQDESDFIAGVNRIGICHLRTGVKIIAYVLMDNQYHNQLPHISHQQSYHSQL